MSYQPIQMPGFQGFGLADALTAARNEQRQQEAQRWAQLRDEGAAKLDQQRLTQQSQHQTFEDARQRQSDQDAVHAEVTRLHNAGLGHQAKEFAAAHGLTFVDQAQTGAAPAAPALPAEPAAPPEAPIQGPVLPGATDPGSQAIQGERDAVAAYPAQMEEHGRQMTEVFPQQQAQYETQQKAFDDRAANPITSYSGPGQSFSVDPMERIVAARAEGQRRADLLRESFASVPEMQQFIGPAAAMVQAGEDIKPSDVFGMAKNETAARLKRDEDAAKATKDKYAQDHAGEVSELALQQKKELARIGAAANAPNRTDGNNDKIFGLLDRRAKALRDSTQFGKLVSNDKTVRSLSANIAEGTEALQHKDAQIQLARLFRQAQPTEGEMHMLYNGLGGWADGYDQFKAKVINGDLSPEQMRQLRVSAKTIVHEHEEDKSRFVKSARAYLGPKSGLDMVPDQAENLFQGMAAELGLDDLPPLYETEGGVTLGTGKKPTTRPRAPNGDGMVTIRNSDTGETKRVSRAEAKTMGAL